MSVHLRCLWRTHRDSQDCFVEHANTTTTSATFTRNMITLITSKKKNLIYGELISVSSEPRFRKCKYAQVLEAVTTDCPQQLTNI